MKVIRALLAWLTRPLRAGWSWAPSPRRRPLRGKDLVFFSAPLLVLLGYLLIGAALDFRNVRQFDDWWSNGAHVRELFLGRARLAANAARAETIEQVMGPEDRDAALIRLHVPRDTWDHLMRSPQDNWGVWLDGDLERDKTLSKIKIKRRGDTSVHWTTDKLTFTFKMDDNELLKGFSSLVFSSKDVLQQYVAANLAQDFHLMSPAVFVAPVFLNNRYYGIYRVIEPVDESFIRRVGHMPGNVFRGDAAERGDVFRGVPRGVFMNPYIWDLPAENTRPAAPDSSALNSFLSALNGSTFGDHLEMLRWIERPEVISLIAHMLLVGDLYHMDNVHNQLWYEDPWSGLLHPIPWDIRLLDLSKPPGRVNKFLSVVLRDPYVIDEVLREVYPRVQNDSIVRSAMRLANGAYDRFRAHFEYDQLRGGMVADVGTPEVVRDFIKGNAHLLRSWTEDAVVGFRASAMPGGLLLDFETRGYTGSDLTALQLAGASGSVRVFADRNGNGVLDASDPALLTAWPGAGRLELKQSEALLSGWDTGGKGLRPGSVFYRFFLTGVAGSQTVVPELRNRLSGQAARIVALDAGAPRTPSTTWHPWQYPVPRGRTIRWSGDVHLAATTRIPEADTLVIAPGTRVRMDPEVSLVIRGQVQALGSAAAPIVFEPASSSGPWGTVALQGAAANGSRFDNVQFVRGGGSVVDRIEYSGMVSVHYARDVEFRHTAFIQNVRSDDSFHAMHASVDLLQCQFTDSNGDAADYDYSVGRIEGCDFQYSRNDGVDLMTSSPVIIGNTFRRSGDKGISIGEDSNPFVFGNTITECTRGIEVKDRSGPLLVNNRITGNGIGLYAQRKNWRYGSGGWPRLINTELAKNRVNMELDENSRVTQAVSAEGASATVNASQPPELDWMYAQLGIQVSAPVVGVLAAWQKAQPVKPLAHAVFEDDFKSVSDGWVPAGGVTLLEKRKHSLTVGLEKKRGIITKSVDWDLKDAGANHTLVIELAARDVDSLVVTVRSRSAAVTRVVRPAANIATFQFVTLRLPAGQYQSVEISATPKSDLQRVDRQSGFVDLRAARIELASWSLFALPRKAGSASSERIAAHTTPQHTSNE